MEHSTEFATKHPSKNNNNEVAKKPCLRIKPFLAKKIKGEKFAKEHCLNTNKNEVVKKQKVRSTKRKFRVDNVRRARNKNEVATEREKQFLANNKKRAKFAKKLRASYNKRVAAKKQELLDRKSALLMFKNEKGLVLGYNTIHKKNGDYVTTPYVFDCGTFRIDKEGYLNDELREPLCENALQEKEVLEADIDSDVATRVDETSG